MRILVTGGAGFIGSHLAEALIAQGHEVVVLDTLASGSDNLPVLHKQNIQFVEGDVQTFQAVHHAMKNIDAVFHLAAMNRFQRSIEKPRESFTINCVGTSNVLEAARQHDVKQVVFASSSSVYGDSKLFPRKESNPLDPSHNYGASKMVGELYCKTYQKIYGLKTTVLRYFSVYGPRQRGDIDYAAVIPKFILAQLQHKPLTVYGDGTQTRSFTYVSDNVRANMLCLDNKKAFGETINVADTKEYSILDLITFVERLSGKKANVNHLPLPKGDIPKNGADVTKAKEVLGWSPSVPLEEGLKKLYEWYSSKLGV